MTDFATANRAALSFVPELVYGVTPATPAFNQLRYTGESLNDSITTVKSTEIRDDRMVSDIIVVDASPAGDANIEFSAESHDEMLEALMMGTWSTPLAIASVAADLVLITTGNHLTSATTDKFIDVVVGQHIKLTGFGASSGYYRVLTKPNNLTLTLSPAPPVANTPSGTTGLISGAYIRNGVTERSFTLLSRLLDTAVTTRRLFTGMRVKSMNLSMKTGAIITGAISFMGSQAAMTETPISGETFVAAATSSPMNSTSDFAQLLQNTSTLGTSAGAVMSFDLTIDNQHREQKGLGVLGNVGVRAGTLMVKASITQYFENTDQYDLFKASTAFYLTVQLDDAAGNSYFFTLPRAKYTEFAANASGIDTDFMAESAIEAILDPTTNCMIQIDRFLV